VYKLQSMCM